MLVYMQLVSRAISILYWRLFTLFTIHSPADYLLLFSFCTVCQKTEKQVTTSSVFICNHSSLEKAGKAHARNWNEWISDVTITTIINIQLVCFFQIEEEADINPTQFRLK